MATHHQCHHQPTPSATTTCYCTMCCTTTHYSPPPPSYPPIHSISSHHHHQHYHNPPQIHQYAPPQNHNNHQTEHHDYYPQIPKKHHLYQKCCHHEDAQETPPPLNPTVSSLVHRIAALESSLRRRKQSPKASSIRHAAARTIQTHFRAFLVRRSVTLRQLKDLAYIKSALNRLKSFVSSKTQFDSHFLSRESMNLLIKLDSIQGRDPMIRDGKRSISRELAQFVELIDEMCSETQVITVKNARFGKNSTKSVILQPEHKIKTSGSRVFGYNERKFLENLKNQSFDVEIPRKPGVCQIKIGDLKKSEGKSQQKVKKNVTFDEDGNVYRFVKSNHKQVSSDSSNADEDEVEEIGVSSKETEVVEDDSSEMSENEMDPRKNLRTRIHLTKEKNQPDQEDDEDDDDEEEDDSFVFSAPLPAKMEY